MYAPQTQSEILQALVARVLAFCGLSDVSETSQFGAILESTAIQLASLDSKRAEDRNSFFLLRPGVAYSEYVQRLQELPPTGMSMLPATPASGAVCTVSRSDTSTSQTLPAGSTFLNPNNGCIYKVTQATVFGIGIGSVNNIPVVCTVVGAVGNCASGDINQPQDVPDWVAAVTNITPLTNGLNAETVEENQVRAANFLSSLARSQPAAMEYFGTTFIGSDGSRLRFAKYIRDFAAGPGFGLLMVDDGTGLAGLTRAGMTVTNTVPANGITLLYHEKPATTQIASIVVQRAAGGTETLYLANGDYESYPEVGIVYIPQDTLVEGDIWTIENYNVYIGIVAELQNAIIGQVTDGLNNPGWMAGGCDVRVITPDIYPVQLWIALVPKATSTISLPELELQVIGQIISFISSLAPGQPLFIAQLIDAVMNNNNLLNIRFYEANQTNPLVSKEDVYVQATQAARTNASLLTILSQAQV